MISGTEQELYSDNNGSHSAHVIDHINAGTWEFDINTNEVEWSDNFYRILGYEPGEIESSADYFFEHLLYHEDEKIFSRSLTERGPDGNSTVQIRLLTKSSGYQWFESSCRRCADPLCFKLHGTIINIHPYKLLELRLAQKDNLSRETGKIAKVAVWELEVSSMNLTLSKEGYDIFGLNNPVKLSLDEVIDFFEPPHRSTAAAAIESIIKFCNPFDMELQIRTAKNKLIWLRFKAIPFIDNYGNCVRLTGIFQDVDHAKKREAGLEDTLHVSTDQNKRLQNFAYIVSHNLRSHSGNLKFMVNLFNQADSKEERDEIFEHIRSISDGLSTTVEHLGEVVKIQDDITKEKKPVAFEPLFKQIISTLEHNVTESGAKIEYDFSKSPQISYIPAYMESILQNLLTNAIKYKYNGRTPVIKCYTYLENNHTYLVFEDNGMGIDLQKHGNDVFGMYKTFHTNSDAKGIGLFITRNQVESLGGTIKLESIVNVGTKFTIKLN